MGIKKLYCILLYISIVANLTIVHSQDKEELSFSDRFIFGGDFGLQFGTVTIIDVSGILGCYITPKWVAGISGKYMYYKSTYDTLEFHTEIYGGGIFTNYMLISNIGDYIPIGIDAGILAHTEYEFLSLERKYFEPPQYPPPTGRFIQHNVFIGGGLRFPIREYSSFDLLILWNVNETMYSVYNSPVIKFRLML